MYYVHIKVFSKIVCTVQTIFENSLLHICDKTFENVLFVVNNLKKRQLNELFMVKHLKKNQQYYLILMKS